MSNEYTCTLCGGTFTLIRDETWSEEKAKEEFHRLFPDADWANRIVLCNDCWNIIKPEKPVYERN